MQGGQGLQLGGIQAGAGLKLGVGLGKVDGSVCCQLIVVLGLQQQSNGVNIGLQPPPAYKG